MITIDGHTFDETLLTGGWVIDAGCRGFELSRDALIRDQYVFAMDIENLPIPNFNYIATNGNLFFRNAALAASPGETEAYLFGNGTANFVKGINEKPGDLPDRPLKIETVKCITLEDIYAEIGVNIDLLKLDIEASEYEVLLGMKNPIPKQISVEFHEHCHPKIHNQYMNQVIEHLMKWYNMNLYIREWPQYKFMDCLFVRRDDVNSLL